MNVQHKLAPVVTAVQTMSVALYVHVKTDMYWVLINAHVKVISITLFTWDVDAGETIRFSF